MITDTPRIAGPYVLDGARTTFPFGFKVFEGEDLRVVITSDEGVESDAVIGTDYSVTLNSNQDVNPGGDVVFFDAPVEGFLVVLSNLAGEQPAVFTNTGNFYPAVLNDALDRATIGIQQLEEKMRRVPISPTVPELTIGYVPVVSADGEFVFVPPGEFGGSGDPTLRSDLARTSGASLIGTAPSGSVQSRLSALDAGLLNVENDIYMSLGVDDGSQMIGHIQSEPGAVRRTVQSVLRDYVSPMDFGAVGNGTADDRLAIQRALDTGKRVIFPSDMQFRVASGSLNFLTPRQQVDLNGSRIYPEWPDPLFNLETGWGIRIRNGTVEGYNHASAVLNVNGSSRVLLEDMIIHNPYRFADITDCNLCHLNNLFVNNIRNRGVRWYGEDAEHRCDVLRLTGVTLSADHLEAPGINVRMIEWLGNCHTMQLNNVICVGGYNGIFVDNPYATQDPHFLMANDLEIDYSYSHGILLNAGSGFYFTNNLYVHGSNTPGATGHGIAVSNGVTEVNVGGGQISGYQNGYGIFNDSSTPVQLGSNFTMKWNDLGDLAGPCVMTVPHLDKLKPILIGDPDSAGTGYRLLRVANS